MAVFVVWAGFGTLRLLGCNCFQDFSMTKKETTTTTKAQAVSNAGLSNVVKYMLIVPISIAFAVYLAQSKGLLPNLLKPSIKDPKIVRERIQWNLMSDIEQQRWSDKVPISFPGAKPVPVVQYDMFDSDFLDKLVETRSPAVVKNMPVVHWPAMKKWRDLHYIANEVPSFVVHAPSNPVVRLHHTDDLQPFGSLKNVNWTQTWEEEEISSELFFFGNKLAYYMSNIKKLPQQLQMDIQPLNFLSLPWRPAMEVNLWMGTPTVTTPAHYDMVHNMYTQVVGKKRFILFPPEDHRNLYLFTALHPSARQSQVNFNAPNATEIFPNFKNVNAHAMEVILEPGQVLFIPAFYFHYVCVVGNSTSVSVSTHSESHESNIRNTLLNLSEGNFLSSGDLSLPQRIKAFEVFINHLFSSDDQRVEFLKNIIAGHWSHFERDRGVIGLHKLIQEARNSFPLGTTMEYLEVPKNVMTNMAHVGDQLRNIINKAQTTTGIKEILLSNFVEYAAAIFLGPLNVDPFLRYTAARNGIAL